jgi:hypothetical protein
VDDDRNRFEIVLACHSYHAEEVGKNVSALSLLCLLPSYAPHMDATLHFTYDDLGPALFLASFIALCFLSLRRDKISIQIASKGVATKSLHESRLAEASPRHSSRAE